MSAQKTILIIEDDRSVARMLQDVLESEGFRVLVEGDGEWGLRTFEHKPVDLVLLDVLVPKVVGFDLVERIRATDKGREVPIILLSGVYRASSHRAAMVEKHRIVDYLDKPVDLERLLGALQRAFKTSYPPRPQTLPNYLSGSFPETKDLDPKPAPGSNPPRRIANDKGSLDQVPFARVLGELYTARATGSLMLRKSSVKKIVYLKQGVPVFVKSNLLTECLGRVMVRERLITEQECERSTERMKRDGKKQGSVLIDLGCISPHNLEFALELQMQTKLYDLFAWTEGKFLFSASNEYDGPQIALSMAPTEMIHEGVRRSMPPDRVQRDLALFEDRIATPSPDPTFRYQALQLEPRAASLIDAMDGRTPLRVLQERADFGREDAATLLYALLCTGLLRAVERPSDIRRPPQVTKRATPTFSSQLPEPDVMSIDDGDVEMLETGEIPIDDPALDAIAQARARARAAAEAIRSGSIPELPAVQKPTAKPGAAAAKAESPEPAKAEPAAAPVARAEPTAAPVAKAEAAPALAAKAEAPPAPPAPAANADEAPKPEDVAKPAPTANAEDVAKPAPAAAQPAAPVAAEAAPSTAAPASPPPSPQPQPAAVAAAPAPASLATPPPAPPAAATPPPAPSSPPASRTEPDAPLVEASPAETAPIEPPAEASEAPTKPPRKEPTRTVRSTFESAKEPERRAVRSTFEEPRAPKADAFGEDTDIAIKALGKPKRAVVKEETPEEAAARRAAARLSAVEAAARATNPRLTAPVIARPSNGARPLDEPGTTPELVPPREVLSEDKRNEVRARLAARAASFTAGEGKVAPLSPKKTQHRAQPAPAPSRPVAPRIDVEREKAKVYRELEDLAARLAKKNYYERLGVHRHAGLDDIHAAYERLARDHHPDRVLPGAVSRGTLALAEEIYLYIQRAYEALSDEEERRAYDRALGDEDEHGGGMARVAAADAAFKRGLSLSEGGSWDEASEAFGEAAELDPEQGAYLAHLGWSIFCSAPDDESSRERALADLELALERSPRLEDGYVFRGLIHEKLGNREEAIRDLRRAVQCNPDSVRALRALRTLNPAPERKPSLFRVFGG